MTIQSVVDNVLEDLERPDLERLALRKLGTALRTCHAVDDFSRDIHTEVITPDFYVALNASTSIPIPERLHKVLRVRQATEVVSGTWQEISPDFEFLGGRSDLRTYFGVPITKTYAQIGRAITLNGVEDKLAICIQHLKHPLCVENPATQGYETDSWILEECPDVVEAALTVELSRLVLDTTIQQVAMQNWAQKRLELLSKYSGELV